MISIKNVKTDTVLSEDIRVHRGFPLGNPYSHLDQPTLAEYSSATREDAIREYEQYLLKALAAGDPKICDAINDLVIKNLKKEDFALVCYCRPLPCHAAVIRRVVESYKYCVNWFSNMRSFDAPLVYQGMQYLSVENFYQAMKLPKDDLKGRQAIASMSPHSSKAKIREMTQLASFDKLAVMEYALRHKFAKGTSWHDKLMSTTKDLVEWNNWSDKFWGKCIFTGQGENHLGKLLMKLKAEYL